VTQFEYLRPHSRTRLLRLADAGRIADRLKRGGLAVLPTETGYMLAAMATSPAAIERAFTVKGRSESAVMHVACASLAMAQSAGRLTPRALRLLGELTPGPVTVIVDKTPLLSSRLVTRDGTVGIRVPDHPATLQVIGEVGAPLTATSLNRSGSPGGPIGAFDLRCLDWPADDVVCVLEDDDAIVHGLPSTLVRVAGDAVEILRPGPVPEAEIRRVAGLTGGPQTADPASPRDML
jgi:L-threonylcarbamoyladenylate synthase